MERFGKGAFIVFGLMLIFSIVAAATLFSQETAPARDTARSVLVPPVETRALPTDTQTAAPQAAVPQTAVPQAVIPQTVAPQIAVPQTVIPQAVIPQATAPQVAVPQATEPQASGAQGMPFQPVKFIAAQGVRISVADGGVFPEAQLAPQTFGFQILKTYRLCVTGIPLYPSVTVYPTLQVIDRTSPPLGQELKYPVIVELSTEDLQAAIQGKFVTRVIYLENPETALPVQEVPGGQGFFDVPQDANPVAVARTLGRPIAVLRIGGRGPSADGSFDESFMFGSPQFLPYGQVSETAK